MMYFIFKQQLFFSSTHQKCLETMTNPVARIIPETKWDPMGPSRYKSLSVSTISCF